MSTYPYMVDIAWDVVKGVLAEWQREPYRWEKEIDVQVEVASRLLAALRAMGRDTLLANYPNAIAGFEGNQIWSRICCEPALQYAWTDGTSWCCRPDVVMWDEADPNDPPDAKGGNWPVLWACEIKYMHPRDSGWDLDKLRILVRQGKVRYGCWLNMDRARAGTGDGLVWTRDEEDGRIWICDAKLPTLALARTA